MNDDSQGVIDPHRLYSFSAIERTLGIKKAGLKEARKKGLEVRYWGRKGYVLGQSLIDFILKNGKSSRDAG